MNQHPETDGRAAESATASWPRRAWRVFNRWRKRYWLFRALIVLALFTPVWINLADGEPLVQDLVRMACRAIVVRSEPGVTYELTRYHRAREAHHLQKLLKAHLDRDGNGRLSEDEKQRASQLGLPLEELKKKCVNADLFHLVPAARRAGILGQSTTASQLMGYAIDTATAETEAHAAPYRKAIHRRLEAYLSPPDYGKWETWEGGPLNFLLHVADIIAPVRVGDLVAIVVCFAVAAMAGAFVGVHRVTLGIIVGVIVGLFHLWAVVSLGTGADLFVMGAGYLLLEVVAGTLGGRYSQGIDDIPCGLVRVMALLGILFCAVAYVQEMAGSVMDLQLYYSGVYSSKFAADFPKPAVPPWFPKTGYFWTGFAILVLAAPVYWWLRRKRRNSGAEA